jgi:pimeloyl-ACP methyl ester carboxylesterase
VVRVPSDDHLLELDDPEWVRRRRVRFIGVDRPGYGYSDPWPEASLLDCAGDFVRVADDLGLESFAALGVSGGGPYVIALGALAPERVVRIAVVSGADIGLNEEETLEELAAELGEEARMLREDPDEWYAGFVAEVTEVDRRVLERPEVRAIAIEMFQEAVRQGAVGWVDDVLRLGRSWPFRLDEVLADVRFHHGEDDTNVPPSTRRSSPSGCREADCASTLARDISLSSITPSRRSWRLCSPPNWDAAVYDSGILEGRYSPKCLEDEFSRVHIQHPA